MFSGLTNQISGWVANKTGGPGQVDPNDPAAVAAAQAAAQQDPNYVQNGAEGEIPMEGDPNAPGAGGMAGMAQGFLAKAMAAKDGVKEKASGFQPPNLGNLGGGMMANISNMIPGQRKEEEVPNPPDQIPQEGMVGGEMVDQQYQYQEEQQYQQ